MSNGAGRFFLLKQGQLLFPGKCVSCGTVSTDREYVDLEISDEFYGKFYFCTECFASIATDLNWVRKSDLEALKEFYAEIEFHRNSLVRENEALKYVLAVLLSNRFPDVLDADDYRDSLVLHVSESIASAEATLFIPKQYEGPDESTSVEGSDDLRSDAADSVDESDSGDDSSDDE